MSALEFFQQAVSALSFREWVRARIGKESGVPCASAGRHRMEGLASVRSSGRTMNEQLPTKIQFFYLKNALFRTLHVDGVVGGLTPRGLIHLAVYSERPAIPQIITQGITAEGRLGEELSREGKEGIVREIDADLLMSKATAVELRNWLSDRILELDQLQQQRGEEK